MFKGLLHAYEARLQLQDYNGKWAIKKLPLKKLCFKDLFIMTGINSPLQKNSILFWDVTRNWITNTKQIIICTKYFQILKEPSSERKQTEMVFIFMLRPCHVYHEYFLEESYSHRVSHSKVHTLSRHTP